MNDIPLNVNNNDGRPFFLTADYLSFQFLGPDAYKRLKDYERFKDIQFQEPKILPYKEAYPLKEYGPPRYYKRPFDYQEDERGITKLHFTSEIQPSDIELSRIDDSLSYVTKDEYRLNGKEYKFNITVSDWFNRDIKAEVLYFLEYGDVTLHCLGECDTLFLDGNTKVIQQLCGEDATDASYIVNGNGFYELACENLKEHIDL